LPPSHPVAPVDLLDIWQQCFVTNKQDQDIMTPTPGVANSAAAGPPEVLGLAELPTSAKWLRLKVLQVAYQQQQSSATFAMTAHQ
jgi:hypothetical protein